MVLAIHGENAPGIQRYSLDLKRLYPDQASRQRFETRFAEFLGSAPEHDAIFSRHGDALHYLSESFLPKRLDDRPAVLLILGNPASQSVDARMCFAFERGVRAEHRFWRALRTTGWLSFDETHNDTISHTDRNRTRRTQLLNAKYHSPFRVGIEVFFTFPSPASAPKWSGVAGLAALFGTQALKIIAHDETARLARTIATFTQPNGAVIAFQRDAYEALRDPAGVPYEARAARQGTLRAELSAGIAVPLFGAPPTRLAHTTSFQAVLTAHATAILNHSRRPRR